MGEFQQYQFQTVDRPLTEEERAEINTWSSRAIATATSVTFTYHYGDFKKEEEKVLEEYFDAMLYVSNWGTKRLLFRFPKEVIDEDAIGAFVINPEYAESYVNLYRKGKYLILDITYNEEEGGGWIDDDEYQLSDLIPLREQLINGDYRCLMMAWLKVAQNDVEMEKDDYEEEMYEEGIQPPIPPGLKKLNAPLTAFKNFLEIDENFLKEVQKQSPNISANKVDYKQLISKLSAKEKEDFLLRLANNELRLDLKFRKHLERLK